MALAGKIFKALKQTRDKISDAFDLVRKEKVSIESLDQLEETLILADIGIDTVEKALDVIKNNKKNNFIQEVESYLISVLPENINDEEYFSKPMVILMVGVNGTGKTTIVKIINGEETLTEGEIQLGTNIKVGYFAQKQTKLNSDMSLLDSFIDETGCFFGDAHGMLKKFLFEKDDVKKRVKDLSPGQRARFAFAIFAFKDYDFLILDEPTNHLDIETKEVIENSLRDFEGTVLLVSHDRFFVERVGITNILNLTEGRLESF